MKKKNLYEVSEKEADTLKDWSEGMRWSVLHESEKLNISPKNQPTEKQIQK